MLNHQFIRFLIVGGVNTVFGYSIYALFIYIGLHYTIAALASTILGVLFNFKTTGIFVFKSNRNSLLFKFIGVYAVIYLLNIACLKIFNMLEVNMYLAGAILILPLAVLSFILNKKYVFKEQK
ncbi:MAG: GtrA family protein [Candidatus Brocadiia bacterium]